jgi:Asp-tRNA(Asn)/Glu-tRNA(Gln) amidotransferase A subunit family amidase
VDRRDFLVRMGALASLGALGGCVPPSLPAEAAPSPHPSPMPGDFFHRLPRPDLSMPGRSDPADLAAWEGGALLRDRALSASEYLEAHLTRIQRWDALYQAFNHVSPDDARNRARELDGGPPRGLLHGIPLAIKDNFHTAGVPTTANSHIFREFVPETDATAVTRLLQAGGVMVGKTQMGPLATTRALTPDGEITTVNAWAPGRPGVSPGGSSSGSATAVAARLAASSVGTQTGGSITVPALAQGLTGLKPTLGRVSLHGVIPLSYTRDHPGPISRDARDAALLLQAMAGPDPLDPRTAGLPPVPDYLTAATPVEDAAGPRLRWPTRIGVPPGWGEAGGAVGTAREAFLGTMEEAGAEFVALPEPPQWEELVSSVFNAARLPERSEAFLSHLREDVRLFGVSLSPWINGLLLSGDEYLKAQRARTALLRLVLEDLLSRCDVILQEGHLAFDMIGLPLIAFPVGMEGAPPRPRPLGILAGAGPFGEERLLALAAVYQARTDWHRRRPPDPFPSEEARFTGPDRESRGRLDAGAVDRLGQ